MVVAAALVASSILQLFAREAYEKIDDSDCDPLNADDGRFYFRLLPPQE